jgi:8-oxo-dGTP diphosphatase
MKMKHFVLGLIFDNTKQNILLVQKKRPDWMKDYYNGIGGKIKLDETPIQAMYREGIEETAFSHSWVHTITFVCPGGTVYVFVAISGMSDHIGYNQVEDEKLEVFNMNNLPAKLMHNLKWIIPLSLSNVQQPIILQANELGVSL